MESGGKGGDEEKLLSEGAQDTASTEVGDNRSVAAPDPNPNSDSRDGERTETLTTADGDHSVSDSGVETSDSVAVTNKLTSERDTHTDLPDSGEARDSDTPVSCDQNVLNHDVHLEMEGEDRSRGKDDGNEDKVTLLLPNGKAERVPTVEDGRGDDGYDDGDDDDGEEVEVMADEAGDTDSRLENLTQSILDLQGKAEAGAGFATTKYVHKRGIKKYSNALGTFLPVRSKVPKDILPVSSAGCLNYCTYGWVTPIIYKVYRKGIDVMKNYKLSDRDSAEVNALRLERLWKEELERRGPEKASFRRVILRAFRTRFIVTFIFLVFFAFFSLLNPIMLIRMFLEYLSRGDVELRVGMLYVVGMLLCELLRSLSISLTWMINYQAGLRIRAGAVTLLYKKILNLKGLKDKTVGELVNLVGNDSQRIFEALSVGPLVLAGPVAMTAGCIYAVFYLGPWALVGCTVFVGFYPFNTYISRLTSYLRKRGIFITDKRVRMMNELLNCIKLIKMYAWETPFFKKICDIRAEERKILEKSAIVQSISTGTAIMVPVIAATLTFVAMVSAGNNLTAAQAFSFVALLNSMRFVLGVLPYGIKSLSEVTVSLKRFTTVLLMQEMEPDSGLRPPRNVAVEVKNATMAWSAVGDVQPKMPEKKTKKKSKEREISNQTKSTETTAMLSENAGEQATLTNISFSLEKGQLMGVCGSVGGGKSSLIQAILGRMDRVSGSIAVGGKVAYVPQQAWIMNSTARDNILFGFPFNEEKYNKVVEACALQTDFDSLVSGDLTEIGERGINLSGGQKQRISLARALYSDSDIYLLDDPLSAVDIHIGRHIFTKCIMGYLRGKSVIFVTHQLQYLPQCDHIVFLKDGQVAERGNHDDMMAQGGEYATLMGIYYKEHTSELVEEEEEAEVTSDLSTSPRPVGLERALSCSSGGSEDVRQRVKIERGISVISKASRVDDVASKDGTAAQKMQKGKLIAAEEMNKGGIDKDVFMDFFKASGGIVVTLLMSLIFLLSVMSQASASIFLSFWLEQGSGNTTIEVGNMTVISDSVTDHPQRATFTLIYGMTVVAMVVFLVIRAITFMKYTLRASSHLHDDLFKKIMRCPMAFFDSTPLGRIVNRFSSDMDEVDVRLPMTCEVFLTNNLHIFFSLGLITYVAPWFLIALVPLAIAFFVIYRIFTRTIRDMKRLDMVSRSPLISHITASVSGIATIHAYGKREEFLQQYCAKLNTNSVPFVMFYVFNRWLALRLDLLCTGITGLTSLIIILTYEHISPAMAGLALSSAVQMTGLFQFTMRLAIETEARFTSVQRLTDYSKTVESEAASIVADKRPAEGWPKKGGIAFRNVQMRYRPNLPLVLKGVSFRISPQEKIGIVGRTGSGKSSLGVSLFRLVELSGGSIKIDDLDISSIGLEDLRSRLSIIPQDPVLFIGTVRYNLDPFNRYSDSELWGALEKCHIKEAIGALELKLEAPVVENGENFSVGERQLLCMARALLRHSKILMLDEATAAIDTETDALVQATLKEAFWDCTMLIIAHRLNTVLSCDKILVMDDGKVAEFDRPSVLMSSPSSVFRSMLEATEGSGLN